MERNRNGKGWSVEEDAILTDLWPRGYSANEIAERLPLRTRQAVTSRAYDLGLPPRNQSLIHKRRFIEALPKNVDEIIAKHVAGMTASEIGREIGKGRDWVLNLIKMLRHHGWDIPTMKGRKTTEKIILETYCDHVFYIVKPDGVRVPTTPAELLGRAA